MEKLFMESMQREYNSCADYAKIADFKVPIVVGSDAKKGKKTKVKAENNQHPFSIFTGTN